jgi:pimeloyl-ACP methyl ester carboxylesterase
MKPFRALALFTIVFFILTGCAEKKKETETADVYAAPRRNYWPEEYYPHYETLFFENGKGYEIRNANSNKLIITLGGGPGWRSAIGRPEERTGGDRFIDILLPLHKDYNIFIPEKFNWEAGLYYLYDIRARERYTVDNILAGYTGVINEYLSQNDYVTIIIAGFSEGAKLLPELYFRLDDLCKISALISCAYGGLSTFEQYEIELKKLLSEEKPFAEPYISDTAGRIEMIESGFSMYREEPYPDSTERIGTITMRWLTSIMFRRPFDFYVDIEIPVLFIHGEMDTNNPVESTRYVENNLPNKPFDYIYYPEMAHGPGTKEELDRLRNDIKEWLKEKGG